MTQKLDAAAPWADRAAWLARRGLYPFPLVRNRKIPVAGMHFKELATRDEGILEGWGRAYPESNTGVYTGKYEDDKALLVVDVDDKGDKHGSQDVLELELAGNEFPLTWEVRTPTGGRHLYYWVDAPVRSSIGELNRKGPTKSGLDIKSHAGLAVAPLSSINGKPYTCDDTPIAKAPDWLIEKCGPPDAPRESRLEDGAADVETLPGAEAWAVTYLTRDAVPAVEGNGGDEATSEVARKLKDKGVSKATSYALMDEHYNPRCVPPWSTAELVKKVDNAWKYGRKEPGIDAPQADFTEVARDPGEPLPVEYKRHNGRPEKSMTNYVTAFSHPSECGYHLAYDSFQADMMFRRHGADADQWIRFTDDHYTELEQRLEALHFKDISSPKAKQAARYVAARNTFDSAIIWLDSLKWDGTPRVDRFFADYYGTPQGEYSTAVSNYWWSGLAGRVLQPGCQCDMSVIVVGEQEAGKTQGAKAMVPHPDYFVEIDLSAKDADLARSMRGTLVGEIGEMRGFNSRQSEEIKQWASRQTEKWVPKFKEFASGYPRRTMLIATTNQSEFLADETGERRWLPLRTKGVDVEAIKGDRDQLWAEGAALFRERGVMWQEAARLARGQHVDYKITDTWQELIARWLDAPVTEQDSKGRQIGEPWRRGDRPVLMGELMRDALTLSPRDQTLANKNRAGRVLRGMGYANTERKRINGENIRVWVKK